MTNLTLHTCNAEQFSCDNAFCITMGKRCDAIEDCLDGSDEHGCGKLIKRNGYQKQLTPFPESGEDVLVNFTINILDVAIDEPSETFNAKISISRNWFDERLMYKHLKQRTGMKMNTLLPEEFEAIWYPYVVFNNIRNEEDWKKTGTLDIHRVIPNDDFKYASENNMHVFKGSENALSLTKEFSVHWKCEYLYHWYPFDTQICPMQFVNIYARVNTHPTYLQHNPDISLNRYTLSRIRMCKSTIHEMKAIVAEVTLGRPIINNLLTVFVPTILLVIISFTSRFFAEEYIDMVIQVNLTILLVLATM